MRDRANGRSSIPASVEDPKSVGVERSATIIARPNLTSGKENVPRLRGGDEFWDDQDTVRQSPPVLPPKVAAPERQPQTEKLGDEHNKGKVLNGHKKGKESKSDCLIM